MLPWESIICCSSEALGLPSENTFPLTKKMRITVSVSVLHPRKYYKSLTILISPNIYLLQRKDNFRLLQLWILSTEYGQQGIKNDNEYSCGGKHQYTC